MAQPTANIRAKSHQLTKSEDGGACRTYEYMCAHPIIYCRQEGFFDPLRNNLMPGDRVRITQFDVLNPTDTRTQRPVATATFTVLDTSTKSVETYYHDDMMTFPEAGVEHRDAEVIPLPEPRYISGDGEAKFVPGGNPQLGWCVFVGDRRVAQNIATKEEAVAIARGDKPLPLI